MIDNFALHGDYTRTRFGLVDWHSEERLARQLIAPFNVDIDVRRPLAEATPVERTIVAIAAALQGWDPRGGVLVLDEPTAVLPPSEVGHLFGIVRDLRAQGAAVLYVSHRLEEIFELADRVTVLRAGVKIETRDVAGLTEQQLVELMLGAGVEADYRAPLPEPRHDVVLEVAGLTGRYLRGASFTLAKGEVLVMCEPTAGVDIGARHAIYDLVAAQAATGVSVLVASSDIEDLIGLCSRVLVLRDGLVADQLTGQDINHYRLVHAMEGFSS
jgi:ABC-type sugar transport system ATPase subunit